MIKLYVVVRADLSPGDQLCQAIHAATDWCMRYPGLAVHWHDDSRYLVVLSSEGEEDLLYWYARLVDRKGLRGVLVREPDLDSYTAIAVEHAAGRWLSALPLAMKSAAMV